MSKIAMSPNEVKQLSQTYSNSSQEIVDMLSKLKRTQGELASAWEGQAFQAFEEQFNSMEPTVRKFGELLHDVYDQLQKIAEIVEETDQKISATISGGI